MGKKDHTQEKALAALVSCGTVAEAAQVAGVAERTIYNWLADSEFKEQYRAARREVVSVAMANLQRVSSVAVNTLAEIMEDSKAPASSRVTASRAVLELAVKAVEMEDILARLDRLEEEVTSGEKW